MAKPEIQTEPLPEFAMGAVGFQDTTNYHTVTPKAATRNFFYSRTSS
jgi:hypothetical protein